MPDRSDASTSREYEKMVFDLDPAYEATAETLWVRPVHGSARRYRIDSVPLFTNAVALHDIVEGERSDGRLRFIRVAEPSGLTTIHAFSRAPIARKSDELAAALAPVTVATERYGGNQQAFAISPNDWVRMQDAVDAFLASAGEGDAEIFIGEMVDEATET